MPRSFDEIFAEAFPKTPTPQAAHPQQRSFDDVFTEAFPEQSAHEPKQPVAPADPFAFPATLDQQPKTIGGFNMEPLAIGQSRPQSASVTMDVAAPPPGVAQQITKAPEDFAEQLSDNWFIRNTSSMLAAAGGSWFGAMARLLPGVTAKDVKRVVDEIDRAADQRDADSKVPKIISKAYRSAVRSIGTAVPASLAAASAGISAPALVIGSFATLRANDAVEEAIEAELPPAKATAYVAASASIEGGIAALFQLVPGGGGFESAFSPKVLVWEGVRQAGKKLGIGLAAELVEESTTEILDAVNQVLMDVDKSEWTPEKVASTTVDTIAATIMSMGLPVAQQAVGAVAGKAVREAKDFTEIEKQERERLDTLAKQRSIADSLQGTPEGETIAAKERPSRTDFEKAGIKGETTEVERAAIAEQLRTPTEEPAPAVAPAVEQKPVVKPKTEKQKVDELMGNIPEEQRADKETVEAEAARRPERTVALNKTEIKLSREARGEKDIPGVGEKEFDASLQNAKAKGLDREADTLARSILDTKNPINEVSDEEHVGMVLRAAQIQNRLEENAKEISTALEKGNEVRAERLMGNHEADMVLLDTLEHASRKAGRETARALSIRRMRINRDDYSLANTLHQAAVAKRDKLSDKEVAALTKKAEGIAEQDKVVAELREQLAEKEEQLMRAEAEAAVNEQKRKNVGKKVKTQTKQQQIDTWKAELNEMGVAVHDIGGLSAKALRLISKMGMNYVDLGMTTMEEVTAQLKKDVPQLSDRDVWDILSGRSKKLRNKAKKKISKERAEIRKQSTLLSKIEDAKDGVLDKFKRGLPASAEVRRLQNLYSQLKNSLLKSERDAARLQKIIDSVNRQEDMLVNEYRRVRRKKPLDPPEIEMAKVELDKINREMRLYDEVAVLDEKLRREFQSQKRKNKPPLDSPRAKKLLAERNAKKAQLMERDTLDRIIKATQEVLDQVDKGYRRIRTPDQPISAVVTHARAVLAEARERRMLQDRKAMLMEEIRTGERAMGPKETRKLTSKELERAKKEVEALQKRVNDQRRQNNLASALDKARRQLEEGWRDLQRPVKPTFGAAEQAMRKELSETRRTIAAEDKIAEIDRRLQEQDFDDLLTPKEKAVVSSERLERAQVELQQRRRALRSAIERLRPWTTGRYAKEGFLLGRALLATMDVSYAARQAALLSPTRPVAAVQAFGRAMRAMFSTNSAEAIDMSMRSHPNQFYRDRAGLFLSEIGPGTNMNIREEAFMGTLAERIYVFGAIVRGSERHMATGLNSLRAAAFDQFLEANPGATDAELEAWADYINVSSGRGRLGSLASSADLLANIFFSPRFMASRMQVPFLAVKHRHHKAVLRRIAMDQAAFVGLGMTMLMLARYASSFIPNLFVTTDPFDSDFGKIVVGKHRVEMWGGMLPIARLVAQIAMLGADRVGLAELKRKPDPTDLISRFFMYKRQPGLTLPFTYLTGKDAVGEEVGMIEATLRGTVVPISVQETFDAFVFTQGSLPAAVSMMALSSVGFGASTYEDELTSADVKRVLVRAGYTPKPPTKDKWPAHIQENRFHVAEVEKVFSSIMAGKIRMWRGVLNSYTPEKAKVKLGVLAAEARREAIRAAGRRP